MVACKIQILRDASDLRSFCCCVEDEDSRTKYYSKNRHDQGSASSLPHGVVKQRGFVRYFLEAFHGQRAKSCWGHWKVAFAIRSRTKSRNHKSYTNSYPSKRLWLEVFKERFILHLFVDLFQFIIRDRLNHFIFRQNSRCYIRYIKRERERERKYFLTALLFCCVIDAR